jgi:hypothetical protein
VLEEGDAEEGHVAGDDDGPIGTGVFGGGESGIEAAERAFAGKAVYGDGGVRGKRELDGALGFVDDDDEFGGDLREAIGDAGDEGLAADGFQGLVAAQAAAHAACEDDGGEVVIGARGGSGHVTL